MILPDPGERYPFHNLLQHWTLAFNQSVGSFYKATFWEFWTLYSGKYQEQDTVDRETYDNMLKTWNTTGRKQRGTT